ncbi:hypothetical protein FBEOM_12588 [Fusarium beomiforme]|uniref:C2H2-type domain-containing protein n=1 Tax=Fusarium beomiforme TaxID=44412 RepID=A0A9P5A7Y2_9HYPO|nr:hypothetical protein FBEOM_12588 [Fusarium beomiforme]
MDLNHRPRQQSTSQPSSPSSQQQPADVENDDTKDVHPEEVLAEARKNLQSLIDSGLSKELLHELVDGSQSLYTAAILKQQSEVQQQKPKQLPLAPPTLFAGASAVPAVKTPPEASTSTAAPAEIEFEVFPEDVFSTSRSSSGLARPVFAPLPAPSISSGSSDYSSIWSTDSGQSSISWQSAFAYNRSQAPLSSPLSNPVSVPLGPFGTHVGTASKTNIIYWCTSCEASFKRKYDWKSHEDGHERRRKYYCPDCNRSFWGPSSFRNHYVLNHSPKICPPAEEVVKVFHKRKYWACGFCSALHSARERHIEHIARHFESGMAKRDWVHSRVIYGLLHQPLINEAWDTIITSKQPDYNGRRPNFSWRLNQTGRVQGFLENEHPGQLQDLLEFFSGDESEAHRVVIVAYDLADIVLTPPPLIWSRQSEDRQGSMGAVPEQPGVTDDLADTGFAPAHLPLPQLPQSNVPSSPSSPLEPSFSVRRVLVEAFPGSLPDFVNSLLEFLPSWEPPVPPGKGRVRWKCVSMPFS